MAIGGALRLKKPGCILQEFYNRSGGREARILIIPAASEQPEAGEIYRIAFCSLGLEEPPQTLEIQQRRDAYLRDCLERIDSATGIFLTGGNQVRLTALIGGTPTEGALQAAYQRGSLIAGE